MGKKRLRSESPEASSVQKETPETPVEEPNEDETIDPTTTTTAFGLPSSLSESAPNAKRRMFSRDQKRQLAVESLPRWLASPTSVSSTLCEPLDSLRPHVADSIVERLRTMDVESLFAVQAAVIPRLCRAALGNYTGDLCVCAPTGSGKTYAYAVPVVNALLSRTVVRLRALIVLPNRDLALQVKRVVDQLCVGSSLVVGLCAGHTSFSKEQAQLVRPLAPHSTDLGGRCRIDILIATPGRIVDHIANTEGFSLQHLRFLVVDEADRLLNQSYQGWLPRVLHAASAAVATTAEITPLLGCDDAVAPARISVAGTGVLTPGALHSPAREPLFKLLFSATLTDNPEKIAMLQLIRPTYIVVHGRSTATTTVALDDAATGDVTATRPDTLTESMCVCRPADKPLVLLHLLATLPTLKSCLVFTASVESSHRLYLLLKLYGGVSVGEYSSHVSQQERTHTLTAFRNGTVRVLVCSDAAARGLDVPSVTHVISYDAPAFLHTYVHRVGRTARAGRTGDAITLLRRQEVRHFKREVLGSERVCHKLSFKEAQLDTYREQYEKALDATQTTVLAEHGRRAENTTELSVLETLRAQYLRAATTESEHVML